MTKEEVIAKLVGRKIVSIEVEDWDDKPFSWLSGWLHGVNAVEIHLDDGTVLDSLGEPLGVIFSKEEIEEKPNPDVEPPLPDYISGL